MNQIFNQVMTLRPADMPGKTIEHHVAEAIDRSLKEQGHPVDEQCWLLDSHEALMRRYAESTFVRLRETERDALIVIRSYPRVSTNKT